MHRNAKIIFAVAAGIYLLGLLMSYGGAALMLRSVVSAAEALKKAAPATSASAPSTQPAATQPATVPTSVGVSLIGGFILDFLGVCIAYGGLITIDVGCRTLRRRDTGKSIVRICLLGLLFGPILAILQDPFYVLTHGLLCAVIQIRTEWRWWRGKDASFTG